MTIEKENITLTRIEFVEEEKLKNNHKNIK